MNVNLSSVIIPDEAWRICVYLIMHVHVHVCTQVVWRPEISVDCFPQLFYTLIVFSQGL